MYRQVVEHVAQNTYCCSIVIVTSIVVAATAATVSDKFDGFSQVGGIIGSAVSAAFLLVLGMANAYILLILLRQLRETIAEYRVALGSNPQHLAMDFKLEGGGVFFRIFKKLFKLVDRWVQSLQLNQPSVI